MHGDDDQIVPIGASAMRSSQLVKGARLKVYPVSATRMCTIHKDQINADLLAFIQSLICVRPRGDHTRPAEHAVHATSPYHMSGCDEVGLIARKATCVAWRHMWQPPRRSADDPTSAGLELRRPESGIVNLRPTTNSAAPVVSHSRDAARRRRR
jgi:hypothetical protein